jgi:hypothetical protein
MITEEQRKLQFQSNTEGLEDMDINPTLIGQRL